MTTKPTIVERNKRLRTNSGKEIGELSFAPTIITPDIIDIEDGGQAMIIEIDTTEGNNGPFVRLHSWDENMQHEALRAFIGKRVEVTIKVIDDD